MSDALVYDLVEQLHSGNRIPDLDYLRRTSGQTDIFSNIDDIRYIETYAALGRVIAFHLGLCVDVNLGRGFEVTVESTNRGIMLRVGIDGDGEMEYFDIGIIDDILSGLGYC